MAPEHCRCDEIFYREKEKYISLIIAVQHETMRTVCFSTFIITKTLQWKCGRLLYLSREHVLHCLDIYSSWWKALYCKFKGDIEKSSYYHLQGDVQASQRVHYVSYMQPVSVDFSFKAVWLPTVHRVLISGPGMSHHPTTSCMERQSQLGLF